MTSITDIPFHATVFQDSGFEFGTAPFLINVTRYYCAWKDDKTQTWTTDYSFGIDQLMRLRFPKHPELARWLLMKGLCLTEPSAIIETAISSGCIHSYQPDPDGEDEFPLIYLNANHPDYQPERLMLEGYGWKKTGLQKIGEGRAVLHGYNFCPPI